MTELETKRLIAWLNGQVDPPWELDAVPTTVLLAGLDIITGEMSLLDRKAIFIDIARRRLTELDPQDR